MKQWILIAIFDNGDEESIGSGFSSRWKAYMFKEKFACDWNKLDEFMPDSDYREVKRLVVREDIIL